MKCALGTDERYPCLIIEGVDEGEYNVPPKLINALQKAQLDVVRAERAIVQHLLKTGQMEEKDIMSDEWA